MRRDIYTVHRHITRLATLSESVIGREEVDSIRYHGTDRHSWRKRKPTCCI